MSSSNPGANSLRPSLRSSFLKAVGESGLGDHSELLLAHARECVHFFYNKPKEELPPGASKVGGEPDLPDSVEWPAGDDEEGRPAGKAEFLAQFNLAEVTDGHGLALPKSGHLWVFVRNTQMTRTTAAIIYREAGVKLLPRPKPESDYLPKYGWGELGTAALTFAPSVALPLSSWAFQRSCKEQGLNKGLMKLYRKLTPGMDNYAPRKGIDGQIGGYSIQDEFDLPREYAITELGHPEFVWDDVFVPDEDIQTSTDGGLSLLKGSESYRQEMQEHLPGVRWIQENNKRIQAAADALQLLFMFRPDHGIGLDFGDGMYLDFLMHRDALEELDFSKVYCALPMLL
ncbi:MAG TPA: DUF1963 domain-containing protein [Tepidisphaeraceae bacterium]|nr:DUF1963 domain-containing protein [Tepidisphaeraceae bacterium]